MRTAKILLVLVLGMVASVVGLSAGSAGAAPYPPVTCAHLAVSTTAPFAGQAIDITGSGFGAHESIALMLNSPPVTVGHATTDAAGSFSTTITIPKSASGKHLLSSTGGTASCPVDPVGLNFGGHAVNGAGFSPSARGLAFTGFDALAALAVALGLIAIGIVAVRSGRRHRGTRHAHR